MTADRENTRRQIPAGSPGALRSQATLEIQTRQAQRLVYGRRADSGRPPIVGLIRFAAMLRPIWSGSAADDPYADWWLVRVESELESARGVLEDLEATCKTRLKAAPAVNITLAESLAPVQVELAFNNPYAFHGAYLLGQYDALVRAILTARHVGMMDRAAAERMLREGGQAVRRAYAQARGYRFLAVTRVDLNQGTAKAARARELLGEVPAEILSGEIRAAYAPEIRARAGTVPAIVGAPATDGEPRSERPAEEADAPGSEENDAPDYSVITPLPRPGSSL